MKKLLLTVMITALLVVPSQGVALANTQEAAPPQSSVPQEEGFLPGGVPAETGALDSMTPAIHAVLLAMFSHDQTAFDPADPALAWETLYNMLSLYGQLDERSEYLGERLLLPSETVMDFAAALFPSFSGLGPLPEALSDRMVYDSEIDSYLLVCGNDSLAEIQLASAQQKNGVLDVTGSLVYLVDGSDLAQFHATLLVQDNMFGYTLSQLEATA